MVWLIVEYGWRLAFVIVSPLAFVVAGLWWWYSRDLPSDHAAVNDEEIALISSDRPPPVEDPPPPPGWMRVLKNRDVLLLMISYSCMNYVFYEVFNWFFYYLVEVRHFEVSLASFINSAQWIAGAAGAALGGLLCDKLCRVSGLRWGCRWPIIVGMILSGILLVAGAFQENPMIAVSMLALCFFFNQMTEGTYWATSIAVGGQFAGAAGGLMNTGANVMGAIGALLVPWLADVVGWTMALASGGVFAVIGAVLLMFVRADEPIIIE
jgi:ACS family glucarate transporter-like MFS transporter